MSLSLEVKNEILRNAGKFNADFIAGLLNISFKAQVTRPSVYIRDSYVFEHVVAGVLSSPLAAAITPSAGTTFLVNDNFSFLPIENVPSYLAGLFITSGYLNSTTRHLELHVRDSELALVLRKHLGAFGIVTSLRFRTGKFIIYILLIDYLIDFLKLIGAHESVLKIEENRLVTNFRIQMQRSTNLEVSNQERLAVSSVDFIRQMTTIVVRGDERKFTSSEWDFFILKRSHPLLSLSELIALFNRKYKTNYTRSAANHWLLKLRRVHRAIGD